MDLLDRYLDKVEHLPPAPTVAIQLLSLFSDPARDIDRIVKLIAHDPSLTAETLKRCNRGYLSGTEPARDMFEAVSRLGLYEIYSIVLGLTASRTMKQVRAKYSWDANRLWRHAVVTAVISSTLAKRVEVVAATAFTAGLLHDIGKLILVSMEGVVYADLVRTGGSFGPPLAAAERSHLGFTHAALGGRLLARWGLPEVGQRQTNRVTSWGQVRGASRFHAQQRHTIVHPVSVCAENQLRGPTTDVLAALRQPQLARDIGFR